ncbi:hypothetical protein HPC49_12335 [Pyxidicoccus fallax]|uniref:Lipoprotein n=1 Tax=Pyxidicoccus fallax TaxID=394095 RepID=A0A848LSL2_9BACT|nr:hypothetical protein [Pyxidicoccus fallax]NMO20659.1 hypothetical protein [Pyxidicoccus fallax]NPC79022.1 hypothetical protein [Pyxidicoccus fallax]
MRSLLMLFMVIGLGCRSAPPARRTAAIDIALVHDSVPEQQTREQLRRLLEQFDVSPWLYTRTIQIDERAIPHSHPVLTLHTRHLAQDMQLLSTFVHEEMHWFLDERAEATQRAMAELRELYPTLPVGFPDGARDLESSYLHVLVNALEYAAMQRVAGRDTATRVLDFWVNDHYRALYRIVLKDEARIRELLVRHGLVPEGL